VVAQGKSACRAINIPHTWRIDRPVIYDGIFRRDDRFRLGGNYDGFEFRAAEGSEQREILVSAVRRVPVPPESPSRSRTWRSSYSLDHYAVPMSGPPSIRVATKQEWDAAGPMLDSRSPASEQFSKVPDEFTLTYRGRTFPKSGEHWQGSSGAGTESASRLSGDGMFLSLNSWSGVDLPSGWPLDNSPSNENGEYFVDIYRVDPPIKVIEIRGLFHRISPRLFQDQSFWLGKHSFVLPLNYEMTKLLFCDSQAAAK